MTIAYSLNFEFQQLCFITQNTLKKNKKCALKINCRKIHLFCIAEPRKNKNTSNKKQTNYAIAEITMASCSRDSDSSASSEGYSAEPMYDEEGFQQHQRDEMEQRRLRRLTREGDWCQCTFCHPSQDMVLLECLCCKCADNPDAGAEIRALLVEAVPGNAEGNILQCITLHPAFWTLCLYKRHLLNKAHQYRADYGTNSLRFRDDNRLCRYLAYREFTCWVYKRLGRHIRKVIPACVVKKIREAFPKSEDELYEGFHFVDDYDPHIHQ